MHEWKKHFHIFVVAKNTSLYAQKNSPVFVYSYPFYQPGLEKFQELKCLIILRLFLAKTAKKRQVSKGSYKLIYLLRPLRNLRALCVNRKGDNRYPVSLKIA